MSEQHTLEQQFLNIQTKWMRIKDFYNDIKHNDFGDKEKHEKDFNIIDNMIHRYSSFSSLLFNRPDMIANNPDSEINTTVNNGLNSMLNLLDLSIYNFKKTMENYDHFNFLMKMNNRNH